MNQKQEKITRAQNIAILVFVLLGAILIFLALAADALGLNITPGFGVAQMLELLLGITSLTIAAFLYVKVRYRPAGTQRSLQADIGWRLAATGLVFLFVTGMADLIGIGTHINPNFARPHMGPLQLGGFIIGILTILLGLFLYFTSRGPRETSSMEFLIGGNGNRKKQSSDDSQVD